MKREIIPPKRGSPLRKNENRVQEILLDGEYYESTFLIKGSSFITRKLTSDDLLVAPNDNFMIINMGDEEVTVYYSEDLSELKIIYDPYKFENSDKNNFNADYFKENYKIPEGYIDTLPKWYSFKFTYPDYNIIFVRPELGISIQKHKRRNEFWEILDGNPIIINGSNVHYSVSDGTKFEIPIGTYHTVINPNSEKFVVLKESWSGEFNEEDILRVYNPNQYY